jgi:hypothetical protein
MRHDEKLLSQMLAILESGPIDFGGILDGKGARAPSKISHRSMKSRSLDWKCRLRIWPEAGT